MSLLPIRFFREVCARPVQPQPIYQTIEVKEVYAPQSHAVMSEAAHEARLREELRQRAARLCLYGDTLRAKTTRH